MVVPIHTLWREARGDLLIGLTGLSLAITILANAPITLREGFAAIEFFLFGEFRLTDTAAPCHLEARPRRRASQRLLRRTVLFKYLFLALGTVGSLSTLV